MYLDSLTQLWYVLQIAFCDCLSYACFQLQELMFKIKFLAACWEDTVRLRDCFPSCAKVHGRATRTRRRRV